DRADAGILQRTDQGVAVLWRVVDLGNVDDTRRARFDHAERRRQHPGIGVRRRKRRSQLADDVTIVVGIDAPIGQDVAQNALVGVAMGIDEAGFKGYLYAAMPAPPLRSRRVRLHLLVRRASRTMTKT